MSVREDTISNSFYLNWSITTNTHSQPKRIRIQHKHHIKLSAWQINGIRTLHQTSHLNVRFRPVTPHYPFPNTHKRTLNNYWRSSIVQFCAGGWCVRPRSVGGISWPVRLVRSHTPFQTRHMHVTRRTCITITSPEAYPHSPAQSSRSAKKPIIMIGPVPSTHTHTHPRQTATDHPKSWLSASHKARIQATWVYYPARTHTHTHIPRT